LAELEGDVIRGGTHLVAALGDDDPFLAEFTGEYCE